MAQTVDSAKFNFITDLSDINQLIARLKTVSITTKELAEATKYLSQLSSANAAQQRAAIADLNKLTAQSRLQTQQEREAAAATRASINEIQRKRQELKLQNEQMGKTANGMNQFRGSIDLLRSSMGGLAAVIGVNSFLDFTTNIFKAQSQIQAFKLSLDALLQDKTASAGLFDEVKNFVKESPFEFANTVTSVQKLISSFKAVGLSADEIQKKTIPVLTSLGNSASALGLGDEGLKRLIYAFTQVQSAGKLMGTELRQVNETGIPLLSLLAEQTGIKIQDMAKAISDGKISFEIFEKAILSAGNAGGVFAGLMDIQAQTVTGRISNLKDTIFYAMGQIGDYFQSTGKSFLSFANNVVEGLTSTEAAFARTMTVVKNLAQVFVSYKAGQMLLAANNYLVAQSQKAINLVVEEGVLAKQASIAKAVEMTNAETAEAAAINQTRLAISAKTAEELKLIQAEMERMNVMNLKQQEHRESVIAIEQEIAATWQLYEANLQARASNKLDIVSKNELIATTQREIVTLQEKLAQQEKIIVSNRQGRADKALSIKTIKDEILAKRQLILTTEIERKEIELNNLAIKKQNLEYEKSIATKGRAINATQAQIASIEREILAKEKQIGVSRAASMQIAAEMAATDANTAAKIKATTAIGRLATATKAWAVNIVKTMGPMVAFTAAIYAVIKAFELLSEAEEEQRMSSLKGVIANNEEANSLKVKHSLLAQNVNGIKNLKEGSDAYRIAAKKIIDQNPAYLKGMDANTITVRDFNAAVRRSNGLLETNIMLLAQQSRAEFYGKKAGKLQGEIAETSLSDRFKGVDFSDPTKAIAQLEAMRVKSAEIINTSRGMTLNYNSNAAIDGLIKKLKELSTVTRQLNIVNEGQAKLERQQKMDSINIAKQQEDADHRAIRSKLKTNAEKEIEDKRHAAKVKEIKGMELEMAGGYEKQIQDIRDQAADGENKKTEGIKASGQKQKQARQEIISDLEKSLREEATALKEAEDNWRNGYDIKYNLYLADMENAKNNIKDKEKLKAKELEIETKFIEDINKLDKGESERIKKEQEKTNEEVLKQIKEFGDDRVALQKSIDKRIEDAEKEALDLQRKNMLLDLDQRKLEKIGLAKSNDEIIKIEKEYQEDLRKLRIKFEAEDVARLQDSLNAKKSYVNNLKSEYWDKLLKDQNLSEKQRLDLMMAFADKMDKEFEEFAVNNAFQQQKHADNMVSINKESYKQQAEDAAKGRQKLIEEINETNKKIEETLGKREERNLRALITFTNSTVSTLENFVDLYENSENEIDKINGRMVKGIIKQGKDFASALRDINRERIKGLEDLITEAKKNHEKLKEVHKDGSDASKDILAKSLKDIQELEGEAMMQRIKIAGAGVKALLQITNTFLNAKRQKEIAAAQKEIELLESTWAKREKILNDEFKNTLSTIDNQTQQLSEKEDEKYLTSLSKLANNEAEANRIMSNYFTERANIYDKYADLVASKDESIASKARQMRDADLANLSQYTESALGILVTDKDKQEALAKAKGENVSQIEKDANFKKLEEEKAQSDRVRKEKYDNDVKLWEAKKKALDAQHKLDVQNFRFQKAMAIAEIGIQAAILTAKLAAVSLGTATGVGIAIGVGLIAAALLIKPPDAPTYPEAPDFANYEKGIDDTTVDSKRSKRVDNKGGYKATLHPGEAVFNKKDMDSMTRANNGIRPTRADVVDVFNSHKNVMYNLDTSPAIAPYVLNGMIKDMGLRDELINVKKEIMGMRSEFSKPSVSVNLDKKGMNVYEQKRNHTVKKMTSRYRINI